MSVPQQFYDFIDNNATYWICRLSTAVAIPSVSADAAHRSSVLEMGNFLEARFKELGAQVQRIPLGDQQLDGQTVPFPPLVLASLGSDLTKKTILVYGHFDVQPAQISDGWKTDPWTLTLDPEKHVLYGRGATDDKGPITGWLNVIEAHARLGLELPVNLKFIFEGMEESDSEGLDDFIEKEAKTGTFFKNVDAVCITDNYWLSTKKPCLTYGVRGIAYYTVTISGPQQDLHSGIYGGMVYESMTALVALLNTLVSQDGKILIDGVNELVEPLAPGEKELYEELDYSVEDLDKDVGASIALSDDKVTLLMGRMRYPSLSIHGIEGAFSGTGTKTVIPAKVTGKFSIRLVPNETYNPDNVTSLVYKHLDQEFAKLGTKCSMQYNVANGGNPWMGNKDDWNFAAAAVATQEVYNAAPEYTREGGSIPVTLTFANALGVSVLLLPMGRGDDGAHSTNEKIDVLNYIGGTKLFGAYLYKMAAATKGTA